MANQVKKNTIALLATATAFCGLIGFNLLTKDVKAELSNVDTFEMVDGASVKITRFVDLLEHPVEKSAKKPTAAELNDPLGTLRLRVLFRDIHKIPPKKKNLYLYSTEKNAPLPLIPCTDAANFLKIPTSS